MSLDVLIGQLDRRLSSEATKNSKVGERRKINQESAGEAGNGAEVLGCEMSHSGATGVSALLYQEGGDVHV